MITRLDTFRPALKNWAVAAAAIAVAATGVAAPAQETGEGGATFTVSYRCPKWKTLEFEDAEKAETHLKTVKKLGCEAAKEGHEGHLDVRYRCPKWKEIAVKDHDAAHKWEKWLKKAGFETRHAH